MPSMIDPRYERLDLHDVDDFSLGHGSQRELLESIRTSTDMALDARRLESGHWEIAIAAVDHLGVLSIIAGLLNSHRIDLIRGDALTLSDPAAKPKIPRKILNVFEVSTETIAGQAGWLAVRQELQELIRLLATGQTEQAHEEVVDRVSKVMASAPDTYRPLMPIDIAIDNERSQDLTFLHVSSVLTPGFLFAFTNALAMLEIDIHYARIRTEGAKVEDTFWIRDAHGHKITSVDKLRQIRTASVLIKQFAYLLPISANPHQALRQFKDLIKYMFRSGGQQSI